MNFSSLYISIELTFEKSCSLPLKMNLKFLCTLAFASAFCWIHWTEICYLPNMLTSINIILRTQMTPALFFSIAAFVFSIVPCVFFLAVALWTIRYSVIEPKSLPKFWKLYLKFYFDWLSNAIIFLIIYWCMNMSYDPKDYYFIRYASLFPNTPISNVYTAESIMFIFLCLYTFYYLVFTVAFRKIVSKFTFIEGNFRFLIRNWVYTFIAMVVLGYHLLIPFLIFLGLLDLKTYSTADIGIRLSTIPVFITMSHQVSLVSNLFIQ